MGPENGCFKGTLDGITLTVEATIEVGQGKSFRKLSFIFIYIQKFLDFLQAFKPLLFGAMVASSSSQHYNSKFLFYPNLLFAI